MPDPIGFDQVVSPATCARSSRRLLVVFRAGAQFHPALGWLYKGALESQQLDRGIVGRTIANSFWWPAPEDSQTLAIRATPR